MGSSSEKLKFELILSATGASFTNSVGKSLKAVSAFQKELRLASKAADSLDRGLATMAGKFGALFGGISTAAFSKSIWDAGVAMQKLDNGFKAITGSSAKAKKEIEFLRQTSDDLGLNFLGAADAYKLLTAAAKGTPMEGEQTKSIFLGIAEASTVLGLSADDTTGALRAISQMMSKGNVQAEELRGQLGERLPGAFKLAAKAMGVTTPELNKMLEGGKVLATDMLPKLADELHKLYAKAAVEQADGAIQNLNRFQNAWLELKVGIADSGFLDVASGRIKDLANAMKDPGTKERIVELSARFFELADSVLEFTLKHGELISKVAGGAVALSALSRTLFMLTGIWNGMNAAAIGITGSRLLPYLATLRNSLGMTQIAALGLSGALGAAAGSTLALIGGFKAGEWLYEWTEPAERALKEFSHELALVAAQYRQFAYFQAADKETLFAKSEKDLLKYKEKLVGLYNYQSAVVQGFYVASQDKTLFGNMTDGAKRAEVELVAAKVKLEQIKTAMGEYSAVAEKKFKQVAESAKVSADTQKAVTGKALAEMEAQYQKYTDEIKRLQDQIAGKEQSLAERLRSMSRSGMSDLGAWKDRKEEAQEYEAAAVKAMKAGDFEGAARLAGKAEDAYADLNEEIKAGEKILISEDTAMKTSMAGVRSAGELAIDILKKQTEAAEQAREALDKESGGKLSGNKAINAAIVATEKLDTMIYKVGDTWHDVSKAAEESWIEAANEAGKALDKMTIDRTIKLYIEKIEKNKVGGTVGVQAFQYGGFPRRSSGQLSGWGGGDKIKALLEAGEFIVRKEAVSKYGSGFFQALNSMKLNSLPTIKARIGGRIHSAGVQRFNTGGTATATPETAGETVTVNLNLPTPGPSVPARMTRQNVNEMLQQIKQMGSMAS